LVFSLGLAVSALLLSRLVVASRRETFVFVGIFVSSPIWLHIGEFNTFSWGVGIALSCVALAATFALRTGKHNVILAALFAGFAVAVYQTMLILYALILLVTCVRNRPFWGEGGLSGERTRSPWGPGLSLALAVLCYYGVNTLVLALLGTELTYVGRMIAPGEFFSSFSTASARTLPRVAGLLTGGDRIFLDWGAAVLLLPWLGFAVGVAKVLDRRVGTVGRRLLGVGAFALALLFAFSPVIISAGRMPTRALVPLPFLYAVIATNAFRARFGRSLPWGAFGLAIFVSLWISTSLFYADHLARQRDLMLVNRLIGRVEDVGRERFGKVIPLIVVGTWTPERKGPAREVEIFGESFFNHNGGNNARVGLYLRLLGIDDIHMVGFRPLRDHLDRVDGMPSWPEAGSVAVVGNAVVVKMGPISLQQKMQLDR
jgi:hypothetical protein